MDTEQRIDRVIRRTQRYWYEDGLTEIGLGALYLGIGLIAAAQVVLPPGPLVLAISVLGLPVLFLAGGWALKRGIAAAKEQVTYPRTGYVA